MKSPSERELILALARSRGWTISVEGSEVRLSRGQRRLVVMFGTGGIVISARDGLKLVQGRGKFEAVERILRRK